MNTSTSKKRNSISLSSSSKKSKVNKNKQKKEKHASHVTKTNSTTHSLPAKKMKRFEKSDQYDALLGEAQDLMGAAAEAQALGRLKLASSYLLLLHARIVGMGKIFDRAISSDESLKAACTMLLRQDQGRSQNQYQNRGIQDQNKFQQGNKPTQTNSTPSDSTAVSVPDSLIGMGNKMNMNLPYQYPSSSTPSFIPNPNSYPSQKLNDNSKILASTKGASTVMFRPEASYVAQNTVPMQLNSVSNTGTLQTTIVAPPAVALNNSKSPPKDQIVKIPLKNTGNSTREGIKATEGSKKSSVNNLHHYNSLPLPSSMPKSKDTSMDAGSFSQLSKSVSSLSTKAKTAPPHDIASLPANSQESSSHLLPKQEGTVMLLGKESSTIQNSDSTSFTSIPIPSTHHESSHERTEISTPDSKTASSGSNISQNNSLQSSEAALLLTKSLPKGINLDTTMMEHLAKAALELHNKRTGSSKNDKAQVTHITPSLPTQRSRLQGKAHKKIAWSEEEQRTCEKALNIYGKSNPDKITKMMGGRRTETEIRAHLKNKEEKEKVDRELFDMDMGLGVSINSPHLDGDNEKNCNETNLNIAGEKKALTPPNALKQEKKDKADEDAAKDQTTLKQCSKAKKKSENSIVGTASKDKRSSHNSDGLGDGKKSSHTPPTPLSQTNAFSHFDARLMIQQGGRLTLSKTDSSPPQLN